MITIYKAQRGFSLVELMVAMVIALLVMAGVINSFIASKEANRINDELAFIQENARYALDTLSRDIRQAGDFGCTASAFGGSGNNYYPNGLVSVVKIQAAPLSNTLLYKRVGIEGFDHTSFASFPPLINSDTAITSGIGDVLVVRRADADQRKVIASNDITAGTFTLAGTQKQSFKPGTFMVAADADCRHQAIFQLTGPATANNSTVEYGGTATPGNCSKILRGERLASSTVYYKGDCSDSPTWQVSSDVYSSPLAFQPGASLMPLKSSIYFIAKSSQDSTTNSLWIRSLSDGGNVPNEEELAEGIVDMRVSYAVNINASVDGGANPNIVYTTANNITADEPNYPATSYMVWNRVVAVRIQLLMRSRTPLLPTAQTHDFSSTFGAGYASFSDRYLYQLVSTTVAVRNAFKG